MKKILNGKIIWLLLLLIAIIFASTTFGTFEGLEMPESYVTEEQRKNMLANIQQSTMANQSNMPTTDTFWSR